MRTTTLGLIVALVFIFAGTASAQTAASNASTISYPVVELGNCSSKSECKTFCDQPQNVSACVAYANSKNLIQHLQSQKMLILQTLSIPGMCIGQECVSYCNNFAHQTECAILAQKIDTRYAQAQATTTEIHQTTQIRPGPGGCTTLSKCAAYCRNNPQICKNIAIQKSASTTPKQLPTNTLFPVAPSVVPHHDKQNNYPQLLGAAAITAILWFFHI